VGEVEDVPLFELLPQPASNPTIKTTNISWMAIPNFFIVWPLLSAALLRVAEPLPDTLSKSYRPTVVTCNVACGLRARRFHELY
jgi:hypothetical protein